MFPPKYAPVSGTVHEINETLNDQPGLLNKFPEDEGKRFVRDSLITCSEFEFEYLSPGWLCKIKVSNPAEVGSSPVFLHVSISDDAVCLA